MGTTLPDQTCRKNQIFSWSVNNIINAFLKDRKSRQFSPNTVRFYRVELGLFNRFLDCQGVGELENITSEIIRSYILDLANRRNPGGCLVSYRAVKTFLRWAWDEFDLETRNPITRVSTPKVNRQPLPGISPENISKLLGACHGLNAQRDKAIILVLFDSGVRASELCSLNLDDVDLLSGSVTVVHGKGDKRRITYMGRNTLKEVRRYLKVRKACQKNDPLFVTMDDNRLTFSGLTTIIRRRAVSAEVARIGLHDFRRAFALNMLRNGADLVTLARMMGHNSIEVLKGYLAITEIDLANIHRRTSPVDFSLGGKNGV